MAHLRISNCSGSFAWPLFVDVQCDAVVTFPNLFVPTPVKNLSNSDENFALYAPKRSINACRPFLCTGRHVLLVRLWTQLECVARFQQHSVIPNFIKPRSEVWGQKDIATLYVVTSRCELLKEWEWKEQKKTGLKISSMVLKRLPPFCSFSGKSCILFRCFLKWLNWDHFGRHVPLFTELCTSFIPLYKDVILRKLKEITTESTPSLRKLVPICTTRLIFITPSFCCILSTQYNCVLHKIIAHKRKLSS